MNPHYLQLASALCAGTGAGLIVAAHYYGARLLKRDADYSLLVEGALSLADENSDLRNVIREQEAALSRYHLTMGKPSEADPVSTQMCGGCGAYLTLEEMDKCPGEACSRYIEGTIPLFPSDHVGPRPPQIWPLREGEEQWSEPENVQGFWVQRKIPIGYTGHLHISKKPLV